MAPIKVRNARLLTLEEAEWLVYLQRKLHGLPTGSPTRLIPLGTGRPESPTPEPAPDPSPGAVEDLATAAIPAYLVPSPLSETVGSGGNPAE